MAIQGPSSARQRTTAGVVLEKTSARTGMSGTSARAAVATRRSAGLVIRTKGQPWSRGLKRQLVTSPSIATTA